MMKSSFENLDNFGRCLKLENDFAELFVTLDIGPRVASYALKGRESVFFRDVNRENGYVDDSYRAVYGQNASWQLFAGHRIWTAPELVTETYTPDTDSLDFSVGGNKAVFSTPAQFHTDLVKTLTVELCESSAAVKITQRITNKSNTAKTFSVWGVSAMAPGGTEILPLPVTDTKFLPNRNLVLWSYTDPFDERVKWSKKYAVISQRTDMKTKFKAGFNSEHGKAYYLHKDTVFSLSFEPSKQVLYPDCQSAYETFTNHLFLEMETLGELRTVAPGEFSETVERWDLAPINKAPDISSDEKIDSFLACLSFGK